MPEYIAPYVYQYTLSRVSEGQGVTTVLTATLLKVPNQLLLWASVIDRIIHCAYMYMHEFYSQYQDFIILIYFCHYNAM